MKRRDILLTVWAAVSLLLLLAAFVGAIIYLWQHGKVLPAKLVLACLALGIVTYSIPRENGD